MFVLYSHIPTLLCISNLVLNKFIKDGYRQGFIFALGYKCLLQAYAKLFKCFFSSIFIAHFQRHMPPHFKEIGSGLLTDARGTSWMLCRGVSPLPQKKG